MWIEEGQRNKTIDVHSKTSSREIPGTECGPAHDLTKTFDTVSRDGLWKIIAKLSNCPAKFIAILRHFHDGMLARIQNDGEFSDPFPVINEVNDVFCHSHRCFPGW